MYTRLAILACLGLGAPLVACTDDSNPDMTYSCPAYFGTYTGQTTPNATITIVAVDGNGANLACEKSAALQAAAMNATGSDKVDCMCMLISD